MLEAGSAEDVAFDRLLRPEKQNASVRFASQQLVRDSDAGEQMPASAAAGKDHGPSCRGICHVANVAEWGGFQRKAAKTRRNQKTGEAPPQTVSRHALAEIAL